MKRTFPFPAYPNGWFAIAYGDEVETGQLVPLEYFGQDIVLYRGDDGVAHVMNAHCPHLGAHIGYGGRVEGDGVRCPFHAWRFGADGKCSDIPYAKRIPRKAKIRSWPVCEQNGLVFIWHHAEDKPAGPPIPPLEEYASADWGDYTRARWQVKSRMYDMGENPVDSQHFKYFHGGISPDFKQVRERGQWTRATSPTWTCPLRAGTSRGRLPASSSVPAAGIVQRARRRAHHHRDSRQHHRIDEETCGCALQLSCSARPTIPEQQRIGKAMIEELKRQFDADVVLFEHKRVPHRSRCSFPEDGPIAEYRRRARKRLHGRVLLGRASTRTWHGIAFRSRDPTGPRQGDPDVRG